MKAFNRKEILEIIEDTKKDFYRLGYNLIKIIEFEDDKQYWMQNTQFGFEYHKEERGKIESLHTYKTKETFINAIMNSHKNSTERV